MSSSSQSQRTPQQDPAIAAAASSQRESSAEQATGNEEQNNNNSLTSQSKPRAKQPGAGPLLRKRSSVQSNLSTSNGGGGGGGGGSYSLSSSTTNTSNEDDLDGAGGGQSSPPRMSNAEYEHIRNTTLLFFLDRLYLASKEGKETRTLHDLSCLFGTREFTKEMRQIVGASRNGLKKFLQSYPSLFQIEGDKVHLALTQDTQQAQRDYNKEAVEYFKQKLLQFGTSLVPIKNLFGYRSQASQEVRHVSGKNAREFKEFLALNEDVFEIFADEHVLLKTALRELESQGQTSLSLQQSLQPLPATDAIVTDPYLNKQFAHLIEDCLRRMEIEAKEKAVEETTPATSTSETTTTTTTTTTTATATSGTEDLQTKGTFRVPLEQLHEQIQKQCQNELFLKMVKTLDDLRVFLRMHPKLFKRFRATATCDQQQSPPEEFVSLVSESERRELEAQAYPAQLQRQHSSLARTSSSHAGQQSPLVVPPQRPMQAQDQRQQQQQPPAGKAPEHVPFSSLPPISHSTPATTTTTTITTRHKHPAHLSDHDRPSSKSQATHKSQAVDARQEPSRISRQGSSLSSHQLRANAPPFVPPSRKEAPLLPPQQFHDHHQKQQQQPMSLSSHMSHRQNSSLATSSYGAGSINQQQQQQQRPGGMQRSVSNLNSAATRHQPAYQQQQQQQQEQASTIYKHQQHQVQTRRCQPSDSLPPIDHRSAIRNYLLKETPSSNMSWNQHHHQQQQQPPQQQQVAPTHLQHGDDMRARTVDMVREASNIITKIMTSADAVAFDCKGYNLGFDGQITLIQFGYVPKASGAGGHSKQPVDPLQLVNSLRHQRTDTAGNQQQQQTQQQQTPGKLKPEVCVFDLITNPELAYCLKPLLESDKIVKIVHDVRNKSNALYVQFKIILNNVFDTQVANLVIQQQDTGKPAYKSRYISMSKLCEIYGNDELMKYRNLIKLKTSSRGSSNHNNNNNSSQQQSSSSSSSSSKDINYWRARPLTKPMIFEATMDVYCLVGGIYQNLRDKIKPEYEPLFEQLNLEGVLARIRPEEIRSAKKERKIDLEVIDLKRKLYGETLGPMVLSNREIRLLRHIDLTDEVRQKIQQCKKVAKKLERLDMKAAMLLEAKQMSLGGGGGEHSISSSMDDDADGEDSSLTAHGSGEARRANGNSTSSRRHSGGNTATSSSAGGGGSSNQSSLLNNNNSNNDDDDDHDEVLSDAERQLRSITSKLDELNATGMMMDSSMFDELKDKMIESSSLLESLEDDDDDAEAEAHLSLAAAEAASTSVGHHQQHSRGSSSSTATQSTHNDCCHCQCHSHGHAATKTLAAASTTTDQKRDLAGAAGETEKKKKAELEDAAETAAATQEQRESCSAQLVDAVTISDDCHEKDVRPSVESDSKSKGDNNSEEHSKSASAEADARQDSSSKAQNDHRSLASSSGDSSKSSVACDMAVQCDLLTS